MPRRVTFPRYLCLDRPGDRNFDCLSLFLLYFFFFELSSQVLSRREREEEKRTRRARTCIPLGPEVAGDLGRSFKWNLRRVHLLFYVSAHDQCW